MPVEGVAAWVRSSDGAGQHPTQPRAALAGTRPACHHGDRCQSRGQGGTGHRGEDGAMSENFRQLSPFRSHTGMTSIQAGAVIALPLLLLFIGVFLWSHGDVNWFQSAFERSVKKLQMLQGMSRDLMASAEAEKSAVM